VRFNPSGGIIASGARDGIVRLWDAASGHQLRTIYAVGDSTGGVFSVSFSPDGKTLAVGSDDADIHLWNVQPNVPLLQYLRIYQFQGLELTPLPAQNLYGGSGFRARTTE
jgi:WD40 repeat protein